jgi:formylglycine-generating enzyme required for sulfatase activity
VAAVWARDGEPWQWLGDSDPERLKARDAELRGQNYVPLDLAVACSPRGALPSYSAVWAKADDRESEVRLLAGCVDEPQKQAHAALVEQKFNCLAASAVVDDCGQPHGCSLWTRRNGQQKSTIRLFHGPVEEFREDDCPGFLLTDAQLVRWRGQNEGLDDPLLLTTALWNISTTYESKVLHALTPEELREAAPRLAAEGYRPTSISAVGEWEHDPRERGQAMSCTNDACPRTTSVWQRPLVPEGAKDHLARRQANAAAALLRLEQERKVWPMFQHRPDPRARSYLIHRMNPLQTGPKRVLAQLDEQDDVSIRRALILALGEFEEQQFSDGERAAAAPRLLELYAADADPGIHGALAWTLRRWGREEELEQVDRGFATGSPVGIRRWFVNRQGQTLAVIPAPGEIVIGSPPYEAGREGGPEGDVEMQHHLRIDHTFAIMTHTVTVDEFLRFRKDFYYRETFSPEPECPINNLNWYEAAAYCNWLNEQEGIPREEWCYLPNEQGEYAQGMRIVPDWLRSSGYRLPTEAEWEHACRAGSITSRYYGQNADLDNHYAWTVKLALGRGTTRVGQFKPNDLGMFDMMGNIMEWIHDPYRDPAQKAAARFGDGRSEPEVLSNVQMRELRPSCYTSIGAEHTRSAAREVRVPPNARVRLHALRASRTIAAPDRPDQGEIVKDDQQRVLMGAPVMHSPGFIRCSYRSRGYSPNFGLFAWGLRPARTKT